MGSNMWDGWNVLAAENINGTNAVIWEFDDPYGIRFFLLVKFL